MPECYEKHGPISIGCQAHGPGEPFGKMKVSLTQDLKQTVQPIKIGPIRHLAIALRVGGSLRDYDDVKISHLRVQKSRGYVGCDIEIPKKTWHGKESDSLKPVLANYVSDAVDQMLDALKRKKFEGCYEDVRRSVQLVCETWQAT